MYSLSKAVAGKSYSSLHNSTSTHMAKAQQRRAVLLELVRVATDNQWHNFMFGLSFCLLETKALKQ